MDFRGPIKITLKSEKRSLLCTGAYQDLKKGGEAFFERVRKLQTTLTGILIVLESKSHGLSENWDGIFRKTRKFKRFFTPKTGDLQKKKVYTEIETDFSARSGCSNAFSGRFTTSTSQLRHPIFFGGGGCFHFFTKNRPQKHQKRAPSSPPRPPGYATGCASVVQILS